MKPLLKWAGGKRQLLPKILPLIPKFEGIYYEPFFGGGAVFFELKPKKAILNDINDELINLYNVFKNSHEINKLISILKFHEDNHSKNHFLSIRNIDRDPKFKHLDSTVRAARFLYLNKACFNGLYRVNSKGFFNVPFNNSVRVDLVDDDNFLKLEKYLKENNINFHSKNYQDVLKNITDKDFVYFDPPYDVIDDKNSFTTYSSYKFGKEEQIKLANYCNELSSNGVKWLLSNHDTKLIQQLYIGYKIDVVPAKRMINSNASKRGFVNEVLIRNY
jgi:DNA adenine methylase